MAIVKVYKFGNTIVRVHDDAYKNKTQEEINEIIRRLEEIASKSYYRQLNEKILKGEADKWIINYKFLKIVSLEKYE